MKTFKSQYLELPSQFYDISNPAVFESPELIILNENLYDQLGLNQLNISPKELVQYFSGQKLLPDTIPFNMAYSGHQFGYFNPGLGDGRAHMIAEAKGQDIQLKGSGRSKFSRQGDGRSELGPVLREYILSEAMHFLGVPTTRSLAAVKTQEMVQRNSILPGGILTRVANGHIRVGTFQYFWAQSDFESVQKLLDYTVTKYFPEIKDIKKNDERIFSFITQVTKKQIKLIAKWMSLGFIHGVMNTDNFSVTGITLDYGPCAFMDEYNRSKVFSSIDRSGRYAYANQMNIAKWNIAKLAECLIPLVSDENVLLIYEQELYDLFDTFEFEYYKTMALKIGITDFTNKDSELVNTLLDYLEANKLDFTLSFSKIAELYNKDFTYFINTDSAQNIIKKWRERIKTLPDLDKVNPQYIPRNHQVEKAIELSYQDDFSHFHKLCLAIQTPFGKNNQFSFLKEPPTTSERVTRTFCGT